MVSGGIRDRLPARPYGAGPAVRAGPRRADALALALYQKAAAAGDPEAHYQIGRLLEAGRGTAVDLRAAAAHYQVAANAGNVEAQRALAKLDPSDRRGPERIAPDGSGRQVAAAANGSEAAYVVAPMPTKDDGRAPEANGAVELVGVRDEIQERLLKFNLPVEDATGSSLSQHEPAGGPAAAVARYRQAAREGDGLAAFKLAQAFEQGKGVPPDLVEALTWYGIAQRQGYAAARAHVEALRGELPSVEVQEASSRIDEWWQKFGSS